MNEQSNALMGTRKNAPIEKRRQLHSSDILPKMIKNRHIDGLIIERIDSADLPDGTTNTQVVYEQDTKKLKIWNSTNGEWDEIQLS